MRKIYSLVLMTAMLLVGTNVWADDVTEVGSHAALKNAINSTPLGGTVNIKLSQTINLDSAIQIYAKKTETGKTINLNLNGYNLETTSSNVIELYKGTLNITGSGQIKTSAAKKHAIYVCGYTDSNASDWSNLIIGSEVQVYATGSEGIAMTIDAIHAKYGPGCKTSGTLTDYDVVEYDFYSSTDPDYLASPIFRYGYVDYITSYQVYSATAYYSGVYYKRSTAQDYAYGVNIIVNGFVYGKKYGFKLNGTMRQTSGNIPNITISSSAEIASDPLSTSSTAIYCSGYGNWTIQGSVHGSTGVYIKSGHVIIDGATIESENPTATPSVGTSSGIKSGGSAVVIEANSSYAGGQNVLITGDATITGAGGYGISETVTSGDQSDINNVKIDGATIEGGNAGAIAVATTDGQTQVYSGNISGDLSNEDGDPVSLTTLIPTGENVHSTEVYNDEGKLVAIVVSEGTAPTGQEHFCNAAADASIKWTGTTKTITTDSLTGPDYKLVLKELEINNVSSTTPQPQELTIGNGVTLEVGKVILGPKAVVTVEAGAKLLVTGEEGIYSLKQTNLVLKANGTQQATFVIGPTVASNRQPHATVEYTLIAGMPTSTTYQWQRFTTPVCITSNPTNNKDDVSPTYMNGAGTLNTWGQVINDESAAWTGITSWADFRPFHAGALVNNTDYNDNKRITYTFTGKLLGNVTDSISRRNATWNYYGNSYMAPMSTKALIDTLRTQTGIEPTIWYWVLGDQGYSFMSRQMALFNEGIENLPALSFFVLKNNSGAAGKLDINYKKTLFDYAVNPSTYAFTAPARQSNNSTVRMNIESENGAKDVFYLLEGGEFTAEYEAGDDVEKLMNNSLNFYAADDEHNYNLLATDNALGTILSLQTTEDINYTITFDKVRGEVYALRDNETNRVVLMNEGATYSFTAQPNATLEGRFQIVSRQEMPTAVETIEETVNAPKAIYTIMGQYVGQDWNTLPAGIYVVDGVKIVK